MRDTIRKERELSGSGLRVTPVGLACVPGTTGLRHPESNLGAVEVDLTEEDVEVLDGLSEEVRGARYDEAGMQAVEE